MKEKERISRDIDRIMADLDNIPKEIPSPYLVERIVFRLGSEDKMTSFRPLWGWLKNALIVVMVLLNFFLCYLALSESGKASDQRTMSLDRMAVEYKMMSSGDLLIDPLIKGKKNGL